MSTDHDVTRALRSWLHEDAHEDADRVLNHVLDRLDTTPQRRPTWLARRFSVMNNSTLRLGLAAAAVIIVVLVGIQALRGPTVSGPGPVQTPSPSPAAATPPASPTGVFPGDVLVHDGRLDPGTYTYGNVDNQPAGFNVAFTVPAGWDWNGSYLSKGGTGLPNGAAIHFFAGPVQVYVDPCHWASAASVPPTGQSVRSLMTGLAAQPLRHERPPIDRFASVPGVVGRWPGMSIELTVPSSVDIASCDAGQFRSWGPDEKARTEDGAGQRDLVWAVDLTGNGVDTGGELLIIDAASFPGTPAEVMSEMQAILGSIITGHWG